MNDELKKWLKVYKDESENSANEHCDRFYLSRPKGYRAIAPTGTISILAGTTSGVEPVYATAYRRRYLTDGTKWKYQIISSTLNLPQWDSDLNNESKVGDFAKIIAKYAHGLRGLTLYPNGSRGGQPITPCEYEEAHSKRGVIYEDNSEEQCLSGVCSV